MRSAQEIFIENLRTLRKQKGLSQLRLSEMAGLSSSIVGDIETGRRNPTLTTIGKLAEALDVPVHQLFYDTHSSYPEKAYSDKTARKILMHQLIDEI